MNEEQLISILRKKGYRITPQRIAICKLILSADSHPSAEDIFKELRKLHPAVSMTTVYHTLDVLKKVGVVSELKFNNKPSRFDPNTSIHINMICENCGRIWDYRSTTLANRWKRLISEIDRQIVGHRLDLLIICDNCKS